MEIKRELEMTVVVDRRFVIRRSPSNIIQPECPTCGNAMLTAEQAGRMFGVNERSIFRIIESGDVHYAETDSGAARVCLGSLAAVVNSEKNEIQIGVLSAACSNAQEE